MISDKFSIIKQNTTQFDKNRYSDLTTILNNFLTTNVLTIKHY